MPSVIQERSVYFRADLIYLAFANYECGTLPSTFPKSVKGNRISGGSVATPNSIPYQARLFLEKDGNKVKLCGGTLVELKPGNGSQWVLTAAHCTYYAEPNEKESTQHTVGAKRIISHPRYDDVATVYDLSLVLLKEYVIYNNEIRSACLPKANEPVPLDVPCFASGWGLTYHGGRGSEVLKIAEMKILPKDECRIKPEEHAIVFCAFGVDRSATCQGDSGGPLVCLINNKATLYGIVSFGPPMCGDARHSVKFAKVPAMLEWVQDTARSIDSTVPVVSRFEPKPSEQKVDQKGTQPSPSVTPGKTDVGQKDIMKDLPKIPTRDNVKDTPNNYKGSDQIMSDFMSPGAGGMKGGSFFNSPRVFIETKPLTVYLLYQEVEVMLLAFANYECGTLPSTFPKSVKGNRISGGSVATPNSIPYQARLFLEKDGNKVKLCGGTLVELKPGNGSQWVLTAAHCTYYAEPNEKESTQHTVGAKRIISHPRYDDVATVYDLSLVLLKEYVIYNNEIRSACLPKANEPVPLDVPCFASGWGLTYHGGRGSEVLKIAEMKILPKDECRIKPEEHAIVFCAFGVDRSATCQGDSGGPLVCLINNKATLYGIVSFGPPMCGDARHSVKFAKVPAMLEWVQDTARSIDSTVPVVSRFEPKPSEQKVDQKGTQPSPSVTPGKTDVGQKDIMKDLPKIPTRDNVKDTPNNYKGSDQIMSDFMSPGAGGMKGGSFFNSPRVFIETKPLTVYLLYQEVEVMLVDLVSMIHHSPFSVNLYLNIVTSF
ncbi:Transmembrane protease serine [Trichinella spiralis]|uniref:Transmembrane protease serine n=2 Tax=Trichinella TaxID=6333 RepID=A0ABR3KUA9_TRISP